MPLYHPLRALWILPHIERCTCKLRTYKFGVDVDYVDAIVKRGRTVIVDLNI